MKIQEREREIRNGEEKGQRRDRWLQRSLANYWIGFGDGNPSLCLGFPFSGHEFGSVFRVFVDGNQTEREREERVVAKGDQTVKINGRDRVLSKNDAVPPPLLKILF